MYRMCRHIPRHILLRRARHRVLTRGVLPPSKAPKRRNKPHWGEREKQLVLDVRRAHPTWGKAKIAVVIQREHGHDISESMVGRILSFLSQERLSFMIHHLIRKVHTTFRGDGLHPRTIAAPKTAA